MQLMYCGLRLISSAVSLPARRGPRAAAGRGAAAAAAPSMLPAAAAGGVLLLRATH
jgi:hypothetical protein